MATFAQLQKRIQALQRQANSLKAKEVEGVIARIKEAITAYGLTAQDLGLGGVSRRTGANVKQQLSGKSRQARYRDDAGNEWSGRGPRPRWLREALGSGKSLADFEVAGTLTSAQKARKARGTKRPAGKRGASRPKFRDSKGNTWTGHGRQPRWFKDALANGSTREQLAA